MHHHDEWILTPQRTAVHKPTATAVIADLHLGYPFVRREKGEAVPLGNLEETLAPLASVLASLEVSRLVVAGDFCEGKLNAGLSREFLEWLKETRVELVGIVPGNHDRRWAKDNSPFPVYSKGISLGRWLVLHGHEKCPAQPVIHGHLHPCFRWGDSVSAPCYLLSDKRIILPAFSEDAAGVNVLGQSKWNNFQCLVALPEKILDFGKLSCLQKPSSKTRNP